MARVWSPRGRAAVSVVVAFVVGLVTVASGVLDGTRDRLTDRFQGDAPLADSLVIVGIDEATLDAEGVVSRAAGGSTRAGGQARSAPELEAVLRPGLSGRAQAALVSSLAAAAPRSVVWLYTRPFQPGDEQLRRAVEQVQVPFLVPVETEILSFAAGLPVVTAAYVPGAYVRGIPLSHELLAADGRVDGVVRHVPLAVRVHERDDLLPSVDLLALLPSPDAPPEARRIDGGVQIGSEQAPTEDNATLRLHYTSALVDGGFDRSLRTKGEARRSADAAGTPYVSALALVAGRVDPAVLRDRVVVVGSVTPTDAERVLVPSGPGGGLPATLVHANAINMLLTRSFLDVAGLLESGLLLLLFAAAGAAATTWLRRWWALPVLAGLVVAVYTTAAVRWDAGVVVPLPSLWVASLLAAAVAFLLRYRVESEQRRYVRGLFSRYVPASVADRLLDPAEAERHAAGERLDVTVLFCDLRGFTRTAAGLPPPDVRDLLNTYYRHASQVVLDREGTVMQYVGDEVFAVFGAPLAQPDHADRALRCALELQAALDALNEELTQQGLPPIAYGIGVNQGEVVAAHVGDERRRQYAVIGDTVNVGARLCSLAGPGEIVCTGEVRGQAHDPDVADVPAEPVGDVTLKGVDRDLDLWRLVPRSGSAT